MKKFVFMLAASLLVMAGCDPAAQDVFKVEITEINAPSEGGVFDIPVISSSSSKATVVYQGNDDKWVELLPSVLNGNGTIRVTVHAYDDPLGSRSATIEIVSGTGSAEVKVSQKPADKINVSKSTIVALDEAGTYSVKVQSTGAWTAQKTGAADWLEIVTPEGESGERTFTVKTSATSSYTETRKASIKIVSGDLETELTVMQGYGILINGIIWAKYDVGLPGEFMPDMEAIPYCYQYNSNIPYPLVGFVTGGENKDEHKPDGFSTEPYAGGDTWEKELDPCPEGWRIPTSDEFAALLGTAADKKFKWGWWYNNQGAWAGNADAATATKDNPQGNIFMVFAGYRDWDTGFQPEADRVWRQTITRPGNNWQRICYVISWTDAMDPGNMENPCAFAIRPVADYDPE